MPHLNPPSNEGKEPSTGTRPTGSAGGRVFGTGTGGNVTSPEYSTALNSDVMQNAESDRAMSKEEADRMYEQRMEEEYAKREGGA
ncbi:hypothetical protein EMGR_004999 [Emarellia grisea]